MSKDKTTLCDLARIHSDPTIQADERASFGNPIEQFPALFAEKGWDSGQGTALVYPASAEKRKQAVAQRKQRIAEWEAQADKQFVGWSNPAVKDEKAADVTFTYGEVARAMREIWAPDDKWIEPEFIHNSCIRRGFAAPFSAYAWHKHENKPMTVFRIPHEVREYIGPQAELQAWSDRIDENLLFGRAAYMPVDMLTHVYKAVGRFGMTESQVSKRLHLLRGQSQKFYPLAQAAIKFPSLKILERCRMQPVSEGEGKDKRLVYKRGGAILLGAIRPAELRCLLYNSKTDGAEQPKPQPLATKAMGKDAGPCTAEQLEKYFALLYAGRENAPKTLGVESLKGLLKRLPPEDEIKSKADREKVQIVRDVLEAVLAGNGAGITAHLPALLPVEEGLLVE